MINAESITDEEIYNCCLNVSRKYFRKCGIMNQDLMNDTASDMFISCLQYWRKGKRPKASLASFCWTYGFLPTVYLPQKRFEEQQLLLEGWEEHSGCSLEDVIEDARYENGRIVLSEGAYYNG